MTIDRTGKRFGRLVVIGQAARDTRGPMWLCRCDCGVEKCIPARQFAGVRAVKSCGCVQREKAAALGRSSGKDRSGQRVGRLLLLRKMEARIDGRICYEAVCDCGEKVVRRGSDLVSGRTTSCGCLHSERTAEANVKRIKHGHARADGSRRMTSPEYRSWKAMLERCRNKNAPNYHLYGGRGIWVCDRWLGTDGFVNFLADMGERKKGLTLDRIDVEGDYTPENCRWADASTQSKNRRKTKAAAKTQARNLAKGRKYWPRKTA